MFRERNERPSTAGGLPAEERSGYMELCEVRLEYSSQSQLNMREFSARQAGNVDELDPACR